MSLHYCAENWEDCLAILGLIEKPNPNGWECFDVFAKDGSASWQYEGEDGRERLYYFFMGIIYGRVSKACEQR